MLRGLKERFPNAHLKAFTAIEIGWFAKREKLSIEEMLRRMRDAGLGSLPGGGAEIFHPEVREIICDGKLDADEWIEVHRVAHRMGLRSNCTMLYGHVEQPDHKVDHLLRLRDLQDETGGFNAFIPLAYHPENNYLGLKYHTTGLDDLRHIATARLVLDNIPHIKAYWVMVTPKLAQVAPALRRRRPRRHGGRRDDLPHGRRRDRAATAARRSSSASCATPASCRSSATRSTTRFAPTPRSRRTPSSTPLAGFFGRAQTREHDPRRWLDLGGGMRYTIQPLYF